MSNLARCGLAMKLSAPTALGSIQGTLDYSCSCGGTVHFYICVWFRSLLWDLFTMCGFSGGTRRGGEWDYSARHLEAPYKRGIDVRHRYEVESVTRFGEIERGVPMAFFFPRRGRGAERNNRDMGMQNKGWQYVTHFRLYYSSRQSPL